MGVFEAVSEMPVRATFEERTANPRSRSAKLRWCRKKSEPQRHRDTEKTEERV
jgi:16S rRNA C1402 N4-methylase RsmH